MDSALLATENVRKFILRLIRIRNGFPVLLAKQALNTLATLKKIFVRRQCGKLS